MKAFVSRLSFFILISSASVWASGYVASQVTCQYGTFFHPQAHEQCIIDYLSMQVGATQSGQGSDVSLYLSSKTASGGFPCPVISSYSGQFNWQVGDPIKDESGACCVREKVLNVRSPDGTQFRATLAVDRSRQAVFTNVTVRVGASAETTSECQISPSGFYDLWRN